MTCCVQLTSSLISTMNPVLCFLTTLSARFKPSFIISYRIESLFGNCYLITYWFCETFFIIWVLFLCILLDASKSATGLSGVRGVKWDTRVWCQVVIKEARGLPPVLSNFVFCQYTFWSHAPTTVPSVICTHDADHTSRQHARSDVVIPFHHSQASVQQLLDTVCIHWLIDWSMYEQVLVCTREQLFSIFWINFFIYIFSRAKERGINRQLLC